MDWSTIIASTVLLIVVYLVYRRLRFKKYHFWLDKSVPYCEQPFFFIGLVPLFTKKYYWEFDAEWCRKFGRIFGTYQAGQPCIYVTEPEVLRRIFVKDFHLLPDRRHFKLNDPVQQSFLTTLNGDDWKRVRSVITPAFSTGKLKKMVTLMDECAVMTVKNLTKIIKNKDVVDGKWIFGAFTMDVIASTAYGIKLNSSQDPDNIFVQHARMFFNTTFPWRLILVLGFPRLSRLFGISGMNPKVMKFFIDLTNTVVEKRKESKEDRGDFLQNLLEAQTRGENGTDPSAEDEATEVVDKDAPSEECQSFLNQYSKTKTLSTHEFVAACVLFFLGGYETTATTIAMVAYFLALNPECQAKVIEEVDEIWKNNPNMDYENLSKLKYMDAVISETLRLIPPAPRIERQAIVDYPIEEVNFTVPKGMIVEIPVYAMHMDPEFFPNPEKFDPERFLPENKEGIRPYTYLPFGTGPRNCLGMRFALMEIKICLLRVFKEVTFEPCAETKIPPEIYKGSGLFQPKDVNLKVISRK